MGGELANILFTPELVAQDFFFLIPGVLFVAAIILMVFGLIAMFFPGKTIKLVYASCGALLFCIYLIYDTQMMMGESAMFDRTVECNFILIFRWQAQVLDQPRGIHFCCIESLPGHRQHLHLHSHDSRSNARLKGIRVKLHKSQRKVSLLAASGITRKYSKLFKR